MIPQLSELADIISTFPGIGHKSATRIAFFLLKQPDDYIASLLTTIDDFHKTIGLCPKCGVLKSRTNECNLCSNDRDQSILCVVEQPSDAYTIENSGDFKGTYHVLMGVLSPLDGIGPDDIRLSELKNRVHNSPDLKEIIIATNPSIEGNATANYIADDLHSFSNIHISRIAMGLAIGSQLEYTDSKIISQSIRNRTLISKS